VSSVTSRPPEVRGRTGRFVTFGEVTIGRSTIGGLTIGGSCCAKTENGDATSIDHFHPMGELTSRHGQMHDAESEETRAQICSYVRCEAPDLESCRSVFLAKLYSVMTRRLPVRCGKSSRLAVSSSGSGRA
jgi:hypothetical protein